jgi:hypothetical protein
MSHTYACYLVDNQGVRAHRAAECFTINASKPTAAALYCERRYTRFVLCDAEGVQVYASDPRDDNGALKSYAQCVDEAAEEKIAALKAALRWALEQIDDDLDLDHQEALANARRISQ